MCRIIGYAYQGAVHCPSCAAIYYADKCDINAAYGSEHDAHGVPYYTDKGEPVSPVFDTDEDAASFGLCDTCRLETIE